MTIDEKKKFLQRAYFLDKQIECNIRELEQLRSLKDSLKGIDYSKERVQESGIANASYTIIVEKIVSKEMDLLKDIDDLLKVRGDVEKAIMSLENQNEFIICKYRYMLFKPWEVIAEMMHMSERHVHRLHEKALTHIDEKRCQ